MLQNVIKRVRGVENMSKKKRKYPELTALKGRIREKKSSYRKLAVTLGIGLNTLSDKINGFSAISGPEMEQIAETLEIDPQNIAMFFLPTYCKTHQSA
jgi:lambda repressor-like predicted transcriptional regulator